MRMLLRAILSVALLLGGGLGDWSALGSPATGPAHEACCCGTPAGLPDTCPCPQPDGNRTPTRTTCGERQGAVSLVATQEAARQRRVEASPVPRTRATPSLRVAAARVGPFENQGRDTDLGRHLARLSLLRI